MLVDAFPEGASVVKLPYREEGNPPILRPTVHVRLTCGSTGEWTTRALIDTGSPLTVFDRGVAEALVISIGSTGCETGYIALLGGRRKVQFEYVELSLPQYPGLSWTARVAFVTDPRISNAVPRNPWSGRVPEQICCHIPCI